MNAIATLTDELPIDTAFEPRRYVFLPEVASTSSMIVSAPLLVFNEPFRNETVSQAVEHLHPPRALVTDFYGSHPQGGSAENISHLVLSGFSVSSGTEHLIKLRGWALESFEAASRTLTVLAGPQYDFHALVNQVRSRSGLPYREVLASRIEEMLEDWDDVPSVGAVSLEILIQFLRERPNWEQPRIYATDAGMFGAEWSKGGNRLSVYAPPLGKARFALSKEDGTNLGGTVRWGQLNRVLASENVSDWLDARR